MESDDEVFNPDVPSLPDGWSVDDRYDSTIRLESPDGCAIDHIIIQPWEEDGETEYVVTPMMVEREGVTKNSSQLGNVSSTVDGAVKYAVGLAEKYANR